jgi:hypothetical protein
VQIFKDSTRKQRSLDCKNSSLNREGNDVKGPHASAHKWGIMLEATGEEAGAKLGRNGPRPASPFRARFGTPFDLPTIQTIYTPSPRATWEFIHNSPLRSREEKDTILERRGSRWLTRAPLAGVGTLHGRPRRNSRS